MPRFHVGRHSVEMRFSCIKLLFAVGLAMLPVRGHAADAISFVASDRVQVFADYYSAGSKAKPLILLFHQASRGICNYRIDACHARIQCACDLSTIRW